MDEVFEQEQAHLSEVYAKLEGIRDELAAGLESGHEGAAQDLIDMSEEIRLNFNSSDETMETLAAIETLNSIIDAYNQYHDIKLDKLRRTVLLLRQPYFAKVVLKTAAGRFPPETVVLLHDGVRPYVMPEVITANIDAVETGARRSSSRPPPAGRRAMSTSGRRA